MGLYLSAQSSDDATGGGTAAGGVDIRPRSSLRSKVNEVAAQVTASSSFFVSGENKNNDQFNHSSFNEHSSDWSRVDTNITSELM